MSDAAGQARRNRKAGQRWESTLLEGFREEGFDAELLRLHGDEDEGDMVLRHGHLVVGYTVVEAKAGTLHPAEFIREAKTERLNFAKHRSIPDNRVRSIVIVKARGKSWKDAYVLTTVRDFFELEG